MADGITFKLTGVPELQKILTQLPQAATRRAMRAAMIVATTPVLERVRQLVPTGPYSTGLLRKSIGRKTVVYPRKNTVVVVIGPRSGFKKSVVRPGSKRPVLANPVKYAHLVELGFHHKASGKFIAPRSFLRAALQQMSEPAQRLFASKFETEVYREAAKLVAKYAVKTGQVTGA